MLLWVIDFSLMGKSGRFYKFEIQCVAQQSVQKEEGSGYFLKPLYWMCIKQCEFGLCYLDWVNE